MLDSLLTLPLDTLFTVAVFVFVIAILVFVHEWGHFAAARSVGVTVHEFSIGFGKAIYRWESRSGTTWKIGLIPLGGYVQMKGQEDGKPIAYSQPDPDSFAAKTVWQRAWVIVAGPGMNMVLAVVVLTVLMLTGEKRLSPIVGELLPEMPAATSGLQSGDIIRVIGDVKIMDWDDVQQTIQSTVTPELQLIVERSGVLLPITITPQINTVVDIFGDEHQLAQVGITPVGDVFTTAHPPVAAVLRGLERTYELTALTFKSLYKLLIGAVSPKHIAGPLGIADLSSNAASQGVYALMVFLAIISINLAIFNLLPVPVLDGGHLLFLLYEAISGKQPGERVQEWSFRFGFGLIICLVIFATANDIRRLNPFGIFAPDPVMVELER